MSIFPGLQSLQYCIRPGDGTHDLPALAHPTLHTLTLVLSETRQPDALPLDLSIFPALIDLSITWNVHDRAGEQELARMVDTALSVPGLRRLAFGDPELRDRRPFRVAHIRRVVKGLPKLESVSVRRLGEGSGEDGDKKRIPRVRRILVEDKLTEVTLQEACGVCGPIVIELNV